MLDTKVRGGGGVRVRVWGGEKALKVMLWQPQHGNTEKLREEDLGPRNHVLTHFA